MSEVFGKHLLSEVGHIPDDKTGSLGLPGYGLYVLRLLLKFTPTLRMAKVLRTNVVIG